MSLTEDSPSRDRGLPGLLAQIHLLTAAPDRFAAGCTCARGRFRSIPSLSRDAATGIELADGVTCGGEQTVRVMVTRQREQLAPKLSPRADLRPEAVYEGLPVFEVDPTTVSRLTPRRRLITVQDGVALPVAAFRLLAARLKEPGRNNPILLKDCLGRSPAVGPKHALLRAAVVIGAAGRRHWRRHSGAGRSRCRPVLAAGLQHFAGGGLPLVQDRLRGLPVAAAEPCLICKPSPRASKRGTEHLKGVKIAIMGCIVNGPGEMADADFGYVGGAPGKINLYVGKTP